MKNGAIEVEVVVMVKFLAVFSCQVVKSYPFMRKNHKLTVILFVFFLKLIFLVLVFCLLFAQSINQKLYCMVCAAITVSFPLSKTCALISKIILSQTIDLLIHSAIH